METYRLIDGGTYRQIDLGEQYECNTCFALLLITVTELVHISRGKFSYNVHVKIELVPWENFCLEPQWMLLTPHYAVYNVGSANI